MRALPIMFLLSVLSSVFTGPPQGRVIDQPDPFAIEFPGILGGLRKAVEGTDINLPTGVRVTRFRVWLLEPYAQRVNYSGFTASLNGQSLATIKRSGSGTEGRFLDIDLTRRADFSMSGAKNVVEVQAREEAREGGAGAVVYRTSFVILVGGPPGRAAGIERPAISCQSIPAAVDPSLPPADQTIPRLTIEEPSQPVEGAASGPMRVRVRGEVIDKAGDSLTVYINGREVTSSLPPERPRAGKRNLDRLVTQVTAKMSLVFDEETAIGEAVGAIIVEARDRHHNRALCNIPVVRPSVVGPVRFGGRKYALLVGVSKYGSTERNLTSLQYADRDASELYNWLRLPSGGGFLASDEILLLTNEQATIAAVRRAITRFLTSAGPDDLIYLFLAGHGGPDPYDRDNYYFLLHDSNIAQLATTAYPMKEIGKFLRQKSERIRLISFLDTCHSAQIWNPVKPSLPESMPRPKVPGPKGGGRAARGIAPRPGKQEPPTGVPPPASPVGGEFSFDTASIFRERGWTVITSAGADELALESERWGGGHGLFTWTLLRALRDGLGDRDGDCMVTAAELGQYVLREVEKETEGRQRPRLLEQNADKLILATIPGCRK